MLRFFASLAIDFKFRVIPLMLNKLVSSFHRILIYGNLLVLAGGCD